jgi:hypothetical protein
MIKPIVTVGEVMTDLGKAMGSFDVTEMVAAPVRGLLRLAPIIGHTVAGVHEFREEVEKGASPYTAFTSEVGEQVIEGLTIATGAAMGTRAARPAARGLMSMKGAGPRAAAKFVPIVAGILGSLGGGMVGGRIGEGFEKVMFRMSGQQSPMEVKRSIWEQEKEKQEMQEVGLDKVLPDYIDPERREEMENMRKWTVRGGTLGGLYSGVKLSSKGGL